MPIVTLTTDWNNNDYYRGAVKGALLKLCPQCSIVDISHRVQPFNIFEAAFIVKNVYKNFPDGTVHIIDVKSEPTNKTPHVIIKADNQFFIGTDNGMFDFIFDSFQDAVKLQPSATPHAKLFAGNTSFAETAAALMQGKDIHSLGKKIDSLQKKTLLRPTIDESTISGVVMYIDSYCNVITNISEDLFNKVRKDREFEIFVQSNHNRIEKLSTAYSDAPEGELLALFNSLGLLEIAIYNGPASKLLNLRTNSTVKIKFASPHDKPSLLV